ncbi:MAG: pilin [Candidatus Nomurabacteria bacterium]|nr:pilin [Candidatus Nomurabacteria bacterium]
MFYLISQDNKNTKKWLFAFLLFGFSFLFVPTTIFATHVPGHQEFSFGSPDTSTNDPSSPDSVTQSGGSIGTLDNPLGGAGIVSLDGLVQKIADSLLVVGVPIVVLGLLYAGFLYVYARGDKTRLETAKKTLISVIVGAILILGAQVFARLIKETVCDVADGACSGALLDDINMIG